MESKNERYVPEALGNSANIHILFSLTLSSSTQIRRSFLLYPALVTLGTVCFASIVALPLVVKARMVKGKVNGNKDLDPLTRFWMEWMTRYRGVVMVLVVLPLSFLFEQYFEFRDWFFRTFQVAPKLHDARVRHVQEQVKRWNAAGLRGKKTMCTARASWLTM